MPHLIAMSGGVDSSVALLLAKQHFYPDSVAGVTLEMFHKHLPEHENDVRNAADAASVCANQAVSHSVLYAYPEFRKRVIDYFVAEYLAGRTPNPCVVCNREIKFGLLSDYARQEGYDKVITGHYARLEEHGGYTYIRRAACSAKDQSYVLASLTQSQLRHAYFPLGELTKDEVRSIAEEHGFVNAHRHDSQDICFVPDGDYVSVIEKYTSQCPSAGSYLNTAGEIIGTHRGHINYTVGQRRGLGVSFGRHMFVLSKNAADNTVTLGDEGELQKKTVRLTALHTPSDPGVLSCDIHCEVKLRYAHRAAPAEFHRDGDDSAILEFETAQRAPTPGQFAVIYDGEYVIGMGVIG